MVRKKKRIVIELNTGEESLREEFHRKCFNAGTDMRNKLLTWIRSFLNGGLK